MVTKIKQIFKQAVLRFWSLRVPLIVVCILLAALLCTAQYQDSSRVASAQMTLNYSEASQGLNPNRTRFTTTDLTSDEVLQSTLYNAGLEGQMTVEQLRKAITVEPTDVTNVSSSENYITTSCSIYKMLYDYEIPSLYANVMTGPQVRNADKLCRNLTQSIESSVQNEQVYQEREAYLSGLIQNYSEKNRDLINYHYHNDANDSGTDYILKNVEAYDDNQSKQITYDSLILEYVEIDKTLRSSAIRRAYTQQLLDTFQAAGGVGGDEASHAAIESEINKYEQTLVDYYQIVSQTSMEHNRSLSADYLQTTSSTRVWPSINTKLYLAIGFVFFFLVGCALAVVVGRSRDFVEYFMYVDKKTGLPNRDRVDAMMARLEKQGLLPSHFTCMCFQFTSLNHLSREYGYSVGNHVLRDFAGLVAALGTEESFIGSNGAGQIMGFFRECNAVKAEAILEVLDEQIQEYNSLNPDYAIEYKAASATSDDEKEFNIRDLLRCAFKKLRDANKPQPETAHETV